VLDFTVNLNVEPEIRQDIRPDIRYPALPDIRSYLISVIRLLGLPDIRPAGYPAKSVSSVSLVLSTDDIMVRICIRLKQIRFGIPVLTGRHIRSYAISGNRYRLFFLPDFVSLSLIFCGIIECIGWMSFYL
jgi:hypothetical protein